MTRVIDETAWWKEPESSWLPVLPEYQGPPEPQSLPAPLELPPPPPYGYRYSEGYGYHPYGANPTAGRFSAIRTWAPAIRTWAPAIRTRALTTRKSALLVGLSVVVAVAVVFGGLALASSTPTTGRSPNSAATQHRASAALPRHAPAAASPQPSTASAGSTNQPSPPSIPSFPPIGLAPGLFAPQPPASQNNSPHAAAGPAAPLAPSAPASPPVVTVPLVPASGPSQMAQWYGSYGSVVSQLEAEATNLSSWVASALSVGDLSGVAGGCQRFGNDAGVALQLPPIPDGTANGHWQAGLVDYQNAAGECVNGVNQQDPSLLNQSANDLASGTTELQTAASAFTSA